MNSIKNFPNPYRQLARLCQARAKNILSKYSTFKDGSITDNRIYCNYLIDAFLWEDAFYGTEPFWNDCFEARNKDELPYIELQKITYSLFFVGMVSVDYKWLKPSDVEEKQKIQNWNGKVIAYLSDQSPVHFYVERVDGKPFPGPEGGIQKIYDGWVTEIYKSKLLI